MLKAFRIFSATLLGVAALSGAAVAMPTDRPAASSPIEAVQYYGGGGYGPRAGYRYRERRASPERIIGRALGLGPRRRGYRGDFRGRGYGYGRPYRGGYGY